MAVEIKAGAQFQFGTPKALFEIRISNGNTSLGVSRDGRFLLAALVEQEAAKPMTVVLNWPGMLKKK